MVNTNNYITYLNLYIGNHEKRDGIEDYIALITNLMAEHDISVRVTTILDPHVVNLIIDEFTNYFENCCLANFKQTYPDSKVMILLTEFNYRKWGVTSFNHFGSIFDAAIITLFDVYFRISRDDFTRPSVGSLFKLVCYFPLVGLHIFLFLIRYLFSRVSRDGSSSFIIKYFLKNKKVIYFHMRYLGLKAHLRYADAVITSHEKIIDSFSHDKGADGQSLRYLGVLYPKLDEYEIISHLMVGKKLFIEVTGTVTRYRKKWIHRINYWLNILRLLNRFGYCMAFPFSVLQSGKPTQRGAYSLHPPQTYTWPYCSPMRIFRALSVDHNLPILTHHFHQNPIEDVCFILQGKRSLFKLFEMYRDPVKLRSFIEPRIKVYNKMATSANEALIENLRPLMDTLNKRSFHAK